MKSFYTRTGDDGFTSLLGKDRVPKYHPRPEAYGDIDEASAALGIARAQASSPETAKILLQVQRDLYGMMAEVAATPENAARFRTIEASHVLRLEDYTDQISELVTLPDEFIVPGDSYPGALLALGRTIIRRAERRISRLYHQGELENSSLLAYLNRLSSLLFVLEIFENNLAGSQFPTIAKNVNHQE